MRHQTEDTTRRIAEGSGLVPRAIGVEGIVVRRNSRLRVRIAERDEVFGDDLLADPRIAENESTFPMSDGKVDLLDPSREDTR